MVGEFSPLFGEVASISVRGDYSYGYLLDGMLDALGIFFRREEFGLLSSAKTLSKLLLLLSRCCAGGFNECFALHARHNLLLRGNV